MVEFGVDATSLQPMCCAMSEEHTTAVVERYLDELGEARAGTVRQLFALANQHKRWELIDLARRLDN
jgi:hypothetical protein